MNSFQHLFNIGLRGQALLLIIILAVAAALGAWLGNQLAYPPALALVFVIVTGLVTMRVLLLPVSRRLRALANAVAGLADGDFAVTVRSGAGDEIDSLIRAFNDTTELLRRERLALHQRELLLDTVVQSSPIAMVLLDIGHHVLYDNASARRLLRGGRPLSGLHWPDIAREQSPAATEALLEFNHGLFDVENEQAERERYMLRTKRFMLNTREYRLVLIEGLTRELNREEVANWKKVVRVISHELNNSVAPISSLLHSGRQLNDRGDQEKLQRVLTMAGERTEQLRSFIDRYASFARLPEPDIAAVGWQELLDSVRVVAPFRRVGTIPRNDLHADRAQLEQVLINLLRNAHQSGSQADEITLTIESLTKAWRLTVADRGPGMSDKVMAHALVPFYSTRSDGSGIGLALSREIIEAHAGQIHLKNRAGGGLAVVITVPKVA